ncbi:MAG: hypothetical protein M3R58_13750, partial [Pseudomonadota bacterium]|nr:hypothetical protein [Pseudomonadota bacterium]
RGTVRFAEGGDGEEGAEGVAGHGDASLLHRYFTMLIRELRGGFEVPIWHLKPQRAHVVSLTHVKLAHGQ